MAKYFDPHPPTPHFLEAISTSVHSPRATFYLYHFLFLISSGNIAEILLKLKHSINHLVIIEFSEISATDLDEGLFNVFKFKTFTMVGLAKFSEMSSGLVKINCYKFS